MRIIDANSHSSSATRKEVEFLSDQIQNTLELGADAVSRPRTQLAQETASLAQQLENNRQRSRSQQAFSNQNQSQSQSQTKRSFTNEVDALSPEHEIVLFIKAGSDRECIGCDPFSQRLFMILWLKGIVFNVTTVDKAAAPKDLREIAPGTPPPFLLFNGEVLTDVIKIEDFLEQELAPPNYPRLKCQYSESTVAGNDVFHKFSAWIKDTTNSNRIIQDRFLSSLSKLNQFLNTPLGYTNEPLHRKYGTSERNYLDGNEMTLADCNLLPKLHVLVTAGKLRKNWKLPEEFTGIKRYLAAANKREEFEQTCCDDLEIDFAYGGRGKRPKQSWQLQNRVR